ncbi:unnamed protein product [Caenorhabditis brenneri]
MKLLLLLSSLIILTITRKSFNYEFFELKNCDPKCTFENMITKEDLSSVEKCTVLCAILWFEEDTNLTEKQLTKAFKNIKTLYGQLYVMGTNLTSLSFLAPLETIECHDCGGIIMERNEELIEVGMTSLKSVDCPVFFIDMDSKTERLNIPNLKSLTYTGGVEFFAAINSHWIDGVCLPKDEARMLMAVPFSGKVYFLVKLCEHKFDDKECKTPGKGCVEIFGNVKIGPGFPLETMKDVEVIYGSLTINGTSLENFKAFENLKYIVTTEGEFFISL